MRRKCVSMLLFLGLGFMGLSAQNAILSSGNNAVGIGGSISYSVGQITYITTNATNGSTSQGVQQAYEISVLNGMNEAKGITLFCSTFPNPAMDFVTVKVENYNMEKVVYQRLDINGRLIESKVSEVNETTFKMSKLLAATYLLKISQNNKEIKTFRIIKK